jgi:hypothetical protein
MKVERLFKVVVIAGASSAAGLVGCGDDDDPPPVGTGGATGDAAATGGAGAVGTGGGGTAGAEGGGVSCDAVCMPDPNAPSGQTWIDCNGCCCWLPAGTPHSGPIAICGEEPCCAGRGR